MTQKLQRYRSRARWWSEEPGIRIPRVLSGSQISLVGLFGLVSLAALCCAIATIAGWIVGGLLFITGIALRTAVVDFTWRGDLAMGLVMFCGTGCVLYLMVFVIH